MPITNDDTRKDAADAVFLRIEVSLPERWALKAQAARERKSLTRFAREALGLPPAITLARAHENSEACA